MDDLLADFLLIIIKVSVPTKLFSQLPPNYLFCLTTEARYVVVSWSGINPSQRKYFRDDSLKCDPANGINFNKIVTK